MVNPPDSSLPTHLVSPVCTPARGADTVTFVPGAQKSLGRHMSCRLSSHPQLPSTAGSVVTVASLSTWARISLVCTAVSNWMATGMPTPTVMPE